MEDHLENQLLICSAKHLPLLILAPTEGFPFLVELRKIVFLLWWDAMLLSSLMFLTEQLVNYCWEFLVKMMVFSLVQDYKQQRPSQELVAKDLHGVEWRFRHIYRGNIDESLKSCLFLISLPPPQKETEGEINEVQCLIPFRSAEAASAYNWMEYFCEPKESCFRGCSSLSEV